MTLDKVVIVLPTYNEKEVIESTISAVLKVIDGITNYDCEILVVDSSSPDKTGQIVKKIEDSNSKVKLLDVKERGLAWVWFAVMNMPFVR